MLTSLPPTATASSPRAASAVSIRSLMWMLLSSSLMLSFTLRSGSLMVQWPARSHDPWMVMQLVMNSGPSMARITSKAEICDGGPRQRVAAVGAGVGDQQPGARQRLQNLGQQRRRNVVRLRDVLGALRGGTLRARARLLGQVLERHQPVIRFFGQTKHLGPLSPDSAMQAETAGFCARDTNPTVLVLFSVRRKWGGLQVLFDGLGAQGQRRRVRRKQADARCRRRASKARENFLWRQ